MAGGRLTVVGTGIGHRRQLIPAAEAAIRAADHVMYQLGDALTVEWLLEVAPGADDLERLAGSDRVLSTTVYEAMAEQVARAVVDGRHVCLVTYGHPGVYQHAAHRSIDLVRAAGCSATMIPGISALDCLIADLGVEIGIGCQLLDATSVVAQNKQLDPTSSLVLFQIGIFGDPYHGARRPVGLQLLADRLRDTWGPDRTVVLYEAAMEPGAAYTALEVPIAELASAPMTERSMAYLAPASTAPTDVVATAAIAAHLARVR